MADGYPAKITIPVNKTTEYEFTLRSHHTVKEFEQNVLENCEGVKQFKIVRPANEQDIKVGDLKKGKF